MALWRCHHVSHDISHHNFILIPNPSFLIINSYFQTSLLLPKGQVVHINMTVRRTTALCWRVNCNPPKMYAPLRFWTMVGFPKMTNQKKLSIFLHSYPTYLYYNEVGSPVPTPRESNMRNEALFQSCGPVKPLFKCGNKI